MRTIEGAIRRAANVDDLFPVIDRMFLEAEGISAMGERSIEKLQFLTSYLTGMRLAMNEMLRRETSEEAGIGRGLGGAGGTGRFLELSQRIAELQEHLDRSLRCGSER